MTDCSQELRLEEPCVHVTIHIISGILTWTSYPQFQSVWSGSSSRVIQLVSLAIRSHLLRCSILDHLLVLQLTYHQPRRRSPRAVRPLHALPSKYLIR